MQITKARAWNDDLGYPILDLEIDGHTAQVFEPKWTLLDAGIVVLLDEPISALRASPPEHSVSGPETTLAVERPEGWPTTVHQP